MFETTIVEAGAAPHRPAGHFSRYSDGEKEARRNLGALLATLVIGEIGDESAPLPVTIPIAFTHLGCAFGRSTIL
ncbi:hypothetical protein, partial [Mesorhizobium sp.]|uniref:hypothetical protein n=1 Tax=Mesorhizobium sp. TaxID=1871066 RepID=UPI0025F2EF4D